MCAGEMFVMGFRLKCSLNLLLFLSLTTSVWGQEIVPPPGGSDYFGKPEQATFSEDSLFSGDGPQLTPQEIAEADGGLFPPIELPKFWSGGADLGITGATGNSELFNLRVGVEALRKTPDNIFTTDFLYNLAKQGQEITTQQALLNARDEILFDGRDYSLFAATQVEYDELREYRFRVGVYGGVGYLLFDNENLTFRTRVGAGATRELGGPGVNDRWVPEMVFGYDFRYRMNNRSSLVSILDYYPRIDDFSQYRVRFRAAYEVLIDPVSGILLRVGLQDRYDSDPGPGFDRNDITYFTSLGVHF